MFNAYAFLTYMFYARCSNEFVKNEEKKKSITQTKKWDTKHNKENKKE